MTRPDPVLDDHRNSPSANGAERAGVEPSNRPGQVSLGSHAGKVGAVEATPARSPSVPVHRPGAWLAEILGMIRFSHTVFALPFALLAAVLAWNAAAEPMPEFRWRWLAGILVAMVGARSAAMAFNRLVDRKLDAANPRTAKRHLPAGVLSVASVWGFMLASVAVFLAGTLVFWPNWLPAAVALPVLAVLLGYSFAKRFTALCHLWLGVALGLAPVCTWLAIRGDAVLRDPGDLLPAVGLGLIVVFWVSGFDIIYACQDADFDRQQGLYSMPAALGVAGALRLAALLHFLTVVAICLLPWTGRIAGPVLPLGAVWWWGSGLIAILLAWEHWLVRPGDLSRLNTAFFNVNAVVSIGLLVLGTLDAIWF